MPIDWSIVGWLVLVVGLTVVAAMIGRFAGWLFLRASGSRVSRRRV